MLEAIQLKELLAAAEGELLQHRALGEEARLRSRGVWVVQVIQSPRMKILNALS